MEPVKIPRRVDEPPHLLLWSMDEILPLLIGLVMGVMIDKLGVCLVVGFIITKLYSKYRDSRPDGYLLHIIYWMGVPATRRKARIFKNPFVRRYFP